MTIRREGKRPPVITCDGDGIVFASRLQGWQRFSYKHCWEEAKAQGWNAKRAAPKSDWQHFCGECSMQDSMAVKPAQNS